MDPILITVLADEAPVGHRSASNDADPDVERLPQPPRPETGARAARARAIVDDDRLACPRCRRAVR